MESIDVEDLGETEKKHCNTKKLQATASFGRKNKLSFCSTYIKNLPGYFGCSWTPIPISARHKYLEI
ncbi:hypothetical protein RN001_005253 [Aquatica leii]|uniref:Uncharacterized protein n=1 Tax=Aquatica leii TaxID=1421715 RepID=A0AAN7PC99_9COLE|nr:hypothetical protein RN001_005253 [Aquatica leii]